MPYLSQTETGERARKLAMVGRPFGPGVPAKDAEAIEKVEVWCSSFKDGGDDYTDFKLFDKAGQELGVCTVGGY